MPSVASVLVLIVSKGNLGEMSKDVLHLSISTGALGTSKVVEPRDLVEEVVDHCDDNGDTDGVTPNNDNGDDGSITAVGVE